MIVMSNKITRIFTWLIFIICISVTVMWISPALGTELYFSGIKVTTEQSIDIPVMIDQVDNLAGVKMLIKYDSKILTYKNAVKTKHTSSLIHIVNNKKPGVLIVVMAGAKGIKGKNFPLFLLQFDIKKGLKNNSAIKINIFDLQLMSDQLKNIKCKIRPNTLRFIKQ